MDSKDRNAKPGDGEIVTKKGFLISLPGNKGGKGDKRPTDKGGESVIKPAETVNKPSNAAGGKPAGYNPNGDRPNRSDKGGRPPHNNRPNRPNKGAPNSAQAPEGAAGGTKNAGEKTPGGENGGRKFNNDRRNRNDNRQKQPSGNAPGAPAQDAGDKAERNDHSGNRPNNPNSRNRHGHNNNRPRPEGEVQSVPNAETPAEQERSRNNNPKGNRNNGKPHGGNQNGSRRDDRGDRNDRNDHAVKNNAPKDNRQNNEKNEKGGAKKENDRNTRRGSGNAGILAGLGFVPGAFGSKSRPESLHEEEDEPEEVIDYSKRPSLYEQIYPDRAKNAEAVPEEPEEKTEIIGVRFREAGKVYYFDPDGHTVPFGQAVVVETARGLEYGTTAISNRRVPTGKITSPLKKIVRIATADDRERMEANRMLEKHAEGIFEEKVAKLGLEMILVGVEYTFDNTKLLFYFSAEGRVDFRELVKELASVFRTRIELRQVGVRDEAKLLGGLGICGRPLCCQTFLGEFAQVSIKMAKDQNLSLNSAKISGTCGRLLCCLRYEDAVYQMEYERTPKVDSVVETEDGKGVVIETNPLRGTVKVKFEDQPDTPVKTFPRESVNVIGRASHHRNDRGGAPFAGNPENAGDNGDSVPETEIEGNEE